MNVDKDSNNDTRSSVTSKYFHKKNNIDESLTDFQETKKSVIGPKKIKNNKPKKAIKKIKGQKDIRTILQSKKHELIKYSEDFDNVCKKSGVDIDSEELQVLIAISKSLQNDTESEHYRSLKLNTQERNSTIRKTLQEYGFKVPNIKIPDRKVKKFKKQYKLLTVSSVEKQQIISDRYSQILLKNLENHSENSTLNGLIPLYNLATNAVYETIRDNSVYYVNNLVEKSNSNGCLFKDYANIPGRPVSPKLLDDCCKMNFSEIDCSQEELDVVLSGNIKSAKNILYSKQRTKCINKVFNMSGVTIENVNNYETENNINLQENKYLACKENSNEKDNETTNSVNKLLTITQTKQYRSCSPDIFDDEVSAILDDNETVNTNNRANTCNSDSNLQNKTTKSITLLTQNVESTHEKSIKEIDISSVKLFSNKIENETTKRMLCGFESENKEDISLLQKHNATKPADDFMDLTECVQRKNIFKIANCSEEMSQYNKTRRKSNDLMEITECISTKAIDNIDLTQCNQKTANKECDSMGENIDLTQSSNSNGSSDELPFVCLNKSNSLDTTVILDENEYTVSSNTPIKLYNQIVNISHDSREGKYNKSIFEDYVHDHSESSRKFSDIEIFDNINNEVNIQNTEKKIKNNNMVDISTNSDQLNYENILQSSLEGYNAKKDLKTTTNYINIIDSNIPHDKSKYSNDENNLSEYLHLQNKETGHQNFKCPTNSNDIDLTQSSNSDEDYNEGNDFKNHEKKYVAPFLLHKNSQLNSLNKASKEKDSEENRNFNIDLTQDKYDYHEILKTQKKLPRTNSLCQENNGSLDYDEINDPNETKTDSVNSSTVHNDKGIDLTEESNNELVFCNNIDSKRNSEPECSQHSEIFEISDKELDYSLYKSRHENCDVSGELNKLEWNKIIPNTSRKDQSNTVNKISKEIENGEENEHCNIDLSENVKQCCKILKTCNKFPRARSLSEKDNVSVDYDINNDYETGEYVAYHIDKELDVEHGNNDLLIINDNFDSKRKLEPNCSQHSEVFEICDQELDHSVYQELDQSVYKSRHENFEIGGLSIMKNLSEIDKQSPDIVKNKILPKNNSPDLQLLTDMRNKATPKGVLNSKLCMKTPENSEYIIKITEVTPILNYESLSTPERNQELDKYGIKPLKRKRAIQLLKHLYNQTHPIVESCLEDIPSPSKKLCTTKTHLKSPRKLISSVLKTDSLTQAFLDSHEDLQCAISNNSGSKSSTKKSIPNILNQDSISSRKNSKSPKKDSKSPRKGSKSPRKGSKSSRTDYDLEKNTLDYEISNDNAYEVTNERPCIKNIECEEDDLVFQKREKAKIHSCRIPLHITFHNYISSRNNLRESILRYEPVNIDVIHKDLVSYGHRYDPKDLLRFLDKKCITVKTSDNNARNVRS